jgi:hypothetical protein
MSKESLISGAQEALPDGFTNEVVTAAGMFFPRGHTGGAFVGGLLGDSVGGLLGDAGSAVGTVGGALGGMHAADARSGLPERMIVAVTGAAVYGFDSRRSPNGRQPTTLLFRIPRANLGFRVRPRVNVRVLELTDQVSGSSIQLEGSRLPGQHANTVINALTRGAKNPGQ